MELNFFRYKNIFIFLSSFFFIISIISIVFKGFNFGVDFKGGTLIEIKSEQSIKIEDLRISLNKNKYENFSVKEFGSDSNFVIYFDIKENKPSLAQDLKNNLEKDIREKITIRRVENVGPKISEELIKAGFLSLILCILAIYFYLWLRFEWQFSLGGIIALIHDIIITSGFFSLFSLQFDVSIVAALLTILGYSINDTVVIYDRIRENLKRDSKSDLQLLINESLNNTLSRTIKTSLTTLFVVIVIFFFGGEVLRGFAFAVSFGIIVGTYSSIFIASPILIYFKVKRDWTKKIDTTP